MALTEINLEIAALATFNWKNSGVNGAQPEKWLK